MPAQRVKAAYLYKFASYVEWPDDQPSEPITIGVLGARAFAEELLAITAGRSVDGRSIRVRQVVQGDELDGLQILFIGRQEAPRLDRRLAPVIGQPILTVTESDGALAAGSIVNFAVVEDRVRFEISLPAAHRNRLRLSSQLLAVAQRVHRAIE